MDAPWDAIRDTPNKSIRQDVPRRGACLHHGALTSLDYLRRLVMGEKQVSSTAIVWDDIAELIVGDDRFRAWSLSSAWGDSSFRSIETVNATGDPTWTISEASHRTLALVVAFWALLDGFWPHRDGDPETWTVVGHREMYTIHDVSYGTSCPGGMDLDLVTRYAQEILLGLGGAPKALTPWELDEKEMNMLFLIKINDGSKRFGGGVIHAVVGPKFWVEVRTVDAANTLAGRFGDAANVTYAEWDAFKSAAGVAQPA